MKNHFVRITVLLTTFLPVLSSLMIGLTSCADSPGDSPSRESVTEALTNTAPGSFDTVDSTDPSFAPDETARETLTPADAPEAICDEVDWGGKPFGILYVDAYGYDEEYPEVKGCGASIINEAVHNRNTLFEEYGRLTPELIPVSPNDVTTALQAEVQAGSGDFELCTMTTAGTA